MDGQARYIIGIDLGTTNCAVAYVDTASDLAIRAFPIPQWVREGVTEPMDILPSHCYLCGEQEFAQSRSVLVGYFAREYGARVPTRLVHSAKSWLCHPGAKREERILPLEADDTDRRLSAVEASTEYLSHIRDAWDVRFAKDDPNLLFEAQEVVLTVPASFDEMARTLTVLAAKRAGYKSVTLLEEPQAAFYAWIAKNQAQAAHGFLAGETILVCDVGGGTTDFSLIEVRAAGEKLDFQRMAVGDHLLLGGDNMDHALAHYLEGKFKATTGIKELSVSQHLELLHHARSAKEALLTGHEPPPHKITLQGKGSLVVQGSLTVEIDRDEVRTILLEGFFSAHTYAEAIQPRKGSALRSAGLHYEEEPSITKHIALFLKRAAGSGPVRRPDYLLFNGGTMTPSVFRTRVLETIGGWFNGAAPTELLSDSLELAVSRGAAYFGKVRRGLGVRIGGGTPRAFYLGVDVDGERRALTLMPRGSEEGSTFLSSHNFRLIPNKPVVFPLYSSHVRLNDQPGDLVAIDAEEMHQLPPIQTVLRYGKSEQVEVKLNVKLTEIGTLELWLQAPQTGHRWTLEFQLRTVSGQEDSLLALGAARTDETFDSDYLRSACDLVVGVFSGDGDPRNLIHKLEDALSTPKTKWAPSILRGICDSALDLASKRARSAAHSERWWQIVGFCLRPGLGYPLDDHRVARLWKVLLAERGSLDVHQQICLRRIACGLSKGQQLQIAQPVFAELLPKGAVKPVRNKGRTDYAFHEEIRLLGSLERLPVEMKVRLGNALLAEMAENGVNNAYAWTLARLGARYLVSGGIAEVVSREVCAEWVDNLLDLYPRKPEQIRFILSHLLRKTNQRELDLPEAVMESVLRTCEELPEFVYEDGALSHGEQALLLGDELPVGLQLQPA